MCLFTDVSDFHWDVIVTQMPKEDLDLDVLVQRHEPLAFLSGTFNRSQKHWSVIEKERSLLWKQLKHFVIFS